MRLTALLAARPQPAQSVPVARTSLRPALRTPTVVPLARPAQPAAQESVSLLASDDLDGLLRGAQERLQGYMIDPRSGLLYRELFLDRLSQAAAGVQRGGASFAVLLIGFEGLPLAEAASDGWGLRMGQRLGTLGRSCDSFTQLDPACYAGLLLGNHSIGGALSLAQKLVDGMSRGGAAVEVRAGVAMCPQHGHDARTLLLSAHGAMLNQRCARGVPVTAQRSGSL